MTVISVATVRSFTRSRRPGRWLDWYAAAFGTLIAALYLGNFLVAPLRRLTAGARGLPAGQGETGLALVLAAAAGLLLLAHSLGPLTLSPADASWLLLSPLDRRGVLRRSLQALTTLAALAGALLGVLALAMAGPYIRAFTPARLGEWLTLAALTGAALSVAAVLALVLLQPQAERARRPARAALRAVALAAVVVTVAGEHWTSVPRAVTRGVAPVSLAFTGAAAGAATVVAITAGLLAWTRLRAFPADVLWADSAQAGRVRLAAAFLNVQLLGWIAEDNHWRRRALTSRRWPGWLSGTSMSPASVLAWADWRRLGRRPGTLLALAASATAPAVVAGAITGKDLGLVIGAVLACGGVAAASQGCAAVRRDTNDVTLRRLLGVASRPALAARAVLPALLATAWLALALALLASAGLLHDAGAGGGPSGGGWLWVALGVAAGPGIAVAALRMARTAPIDAGVLVTFDTGMGSTPPWLVSRALSALLAVIGSFPLLRVIISALGGASHGPPPLAGSIALQLVVSAVVMGAYLLMATVSEPNVPGR